MPGHVLESVRGGPFGCEQIVSRRTCCAGRATVRDMSAVADPSRSTGPFYLCDKHAGELYEDFVPASPAQRGNQCHEGRARDDKLRAPCAPHSWVGGTAWLKEHGENRRGEIYNAQWARKGYLADGGSPADEVFFCDAHVGLHATPKEGKSVPKYPIKQSDFERDLIRGHYCEWGKKSEGRKGTCGAEVAEAKWSRQMAFRHAGPNGNSHPNYLCEKHYAMLAGDVDTLQHKTVMVGDEKAARKIATREAAFEKFCRKLVAEGRLARLRRVEVEVELYGIEKVMAELKREEA